MAVDADRLVSNMDDLLRCTLGEEVEIEVVRGDTGLPNALGLLRCILAATAAARWVLILGRA